ncbi:MAG: hypothetical protein ACM3NQ_25440 [Bacteroidales bacterium]
MAPEDLAQVAGVLNSWKEIAAYLDRDVRTVMRWERTRGLPVHRLPGGPKAGVYALPAELESWRRGRKLALVDGRPEPQPAAAAPARTVELNRKPALAIALLACLVVVAAIFLVARFVAGRSDQPRPPEVTRLTFDRASNAPTISADGRVVAYASDRDGKSDIYVQRIGSQQAVRLTHDEAANSQPSLSPDASRVAFHSDRSGGGLYLADTVGGSERRIADLGSFPRFSPDGSSIAYLVRNAFTRRAKIFVMPADGGQPRPFEPEFDVPPIGTLFSALMWSPDGKHLLFEGVQGGDGATRGLWVAPAESGGAARVQNVPALPRGSIRIFMAWAGEYVYYVQGTSVHGAPLMRARLLSNPWRMAGTPEPLMSSSVVCGTTAVSRDGTVVFASAGPLVNTIWSIGLRSNLAATSGTARNETTDGYNQLAMAVAANGSRLAWLGNPVAGRLEIRLTDVGSRAVSTLPLADDSRVPIIRLSADGSRLGFSDVVNGKTVSRIVPTSDLGPGTPLCEDCSLVGFFSKSPAHVLIADGPRLVRQDVSTGGRTTLVEGVTAAAVLSPDDRWVAFVAARPGGAAGLFVAPVLERPVRQDEWMLVTEDRNYVGSPQWSPNGNLLYYVCKRDSFSCVWAQAFDEAAKRFGPPIHVYHDSGTPSLEASSSRSIAVTPERLYLMLASATSSVWTMKFDRRAR